VTYETLEASTQDGAPVYKFLFAEGVNEYRYTTAAYFISDSTGTWEPVAIRASSVTQTNELAKNGIKITMPRTNSVAGLFLGRVPERTMSVTIFRTHDGDIEDRVWWRGRVSGVDVSGDQVTLDCEDIYTSMRRPGLRARYQKGCRHSLYSPQCGVNMYDYAQGVEILSESGFELTITGLSDSVGDSVGDSVSGGTVQLPDGYYSGGIIELADGSLRYITSQTGNTLTLLSPFDTIDVDSVGVSATIYPGCAHNISDCKDKFDNLLNYGGFPYIPGRNPFSGNVTGSIA